MSRKIFVIDTSVLLYDKNCLEILKGNNIIFTLTVLEELDRFKDEPGILGVSARHINRFLDSIRDIDTDEDGWKYIEELDLKLMYYGYISSHNHLGKYDLNLSVPDNNILLAAMNISSQNYQGSQEIIVLTKDRNLRVKCDMIKDIERNINIKGEDYYNDYIETDIENYRGHIEIEALKNVVDEYYKDGYVYPDGETEKLLNENCFVSCTAIDSESSSFLGKYVNEQIVPLVNDEIILKGNKTVKAKNKEQKFAIDALLDEELPLVTLTGPAGSGKTFLALMSALSIVDRSDIGNKLEKEGFFRPKRIIITRTLQHVGKKDLGYLPGGLLDKMAPYLAPLVDNMRVNFNDPNYFNILIEKGIIDIVPIPYMRGRSFNDAIVIVDEAQNATIHELKTIITRIGTNSKIILLGDTDQIDTPYINKFSNGLSIVIERFKNSILASHIYLERGQRSVLATEASSIL